MQFHDTEVKQSSCCHISERDTKQHTHTLTQREARHSQLVSKLLPATSPVRFEVAFDFGDSSFGSAEYDAAASSEASPSIAAAEPALQSQPHTNSENEADSAFHTANATNR